MSLSNAPALKSSDAQVGEALAAALPAIIMDARRAAASIVIGEHGKSRAGIGEIFWQHREWVNGESVRQIDWRRSARSDKLFVRERERQVPALLQIWCDSRASMNWRSAVSTPTKAERGLVLGLALAIATRAGGERVIALGESVPFRNEGDFANVLLAQGQNFEPTPKAGQVLVVSDGLESPEIWSHRAKNIAAARAQLIVVLVSDRAEIDFPYQGRNQFDAPLTGAPIRPVIIGRAQMAQDAYRLAYKAHFIAVERAIVAGGGMVMQHVTDLATMPVLVELAKALSNAAPTRQVA